MSRIKLNELNDSALKQRILSTIAREDARKDRVTDCSPEQEQDGQHALGKKEQSSALVERAFVVVHTWRARSYDADNVSIKAILDAIVDSGILEDDRLENVAGYSSIPHRCKHMKDERTEIEIWEITT